MKTLHPTGAFDTTITCGVLVPHDLMSPAYRKGDIVLCAPCDTIKKGEDYIITTGPTDGPRHAGVQRFVSVVRVTAREIFAREYNPPKVRRLSRRKWRGLYWITGKYNRGHAMAERISRPAA